MTIFDTSLEAFYEDVLAPSCERPVLVDFWAEWCAPCRVIAPVLEHVMQQLAGTASLAKPEVDRGANMKLAGQYRVRRWPGSGAFQRSQIQNPGSVLY